MDDISFDDAELEASPAAAFSDGADALDDPFGAEAVRYSRRHASTRPGAAARANGTNALASEGGRTLIRTSDMERRTPNAANAASNRSLPSPAFFRSTPGGTGGGARGGGDDGPLRRGRGCRRAGAGGGRGGGGGRRGRPFRSGRRAQRQGRLRQGVGGGPGREGRSRRPKKGPTRRGGECFWGGGGPPPAPRPHQCAASGETLTSLSQARDELAKWQAEREVLRAATFSKNRDEEKIVLDQIDADLASENPWQRVTSLVDMTADAKDDQVARMRQLFIQMKNE